MDPINYTLTIQRILIIVFGVSFLSLSGILVFFNPEESIWYIWLFLLNLLVFLSCAFTFLNFWWNFNIKKIILTKTQVNKLLYGSTVLSLGLVFGLSLYLTQNFTFLNVFGIIVSLILYRMWLFN